MVCCVVCGDWFPHVGPDRLDICGECLTLNFSGTQPPLDVGARAALEAEDPWQPPAHVPASATARAALEGFLASAHQMTPRQVEAMRRMAEAWRRQEAD